MSDNDVELPERIWLMQFEDDQKASMVWFSTPAAVRQALPDFQRPFRVIDNARALPPYSTAPAQCLKCPHDSHVGRCVIPVREYDGEDVIEGLCGCEFTAPDDVQPAGSVWCEACQSYHPIPRTPEHKAELSCKGTWYFADATQPVPTTEAREAEKDRVDAAAIVSYYPSVKGSEKIALENDIAQALASARAAALSSTPSEPKGE